LRRRFGLDLATLLSLCRQIGEATAREGLPVGDELKQAIEVRNQELGEAQVRRSIMYYAALESERDRLLKARNEGTAVIDLPGGLTLESALELIETRIAEQDRYVISIKDGYMVQSLAKPVAAAAV
jgi:hypothetical protein